MDKVFYETKKLVREQVRKNTFNPADGKFIGIKRGYLYSNENIDAYLNGVDFSKYSNALAVLSSGDHAFNLVTNGVMNIDTFDVNELTEYIALGFKRAMLLKYSYQEYLLVNDKLMNHDTSLDEVSTIIFDLLPFMENKHRDFWKRLMDFNYKLQKNKKKKMNLFHLICLNSPRYHIENNKYLINEEYYEQLRRNIAQANISFNLCDALYLPYDFVNKEYDLVLLSNILDYFNNHFGDFWALKIFYDYINSLEGIVKDHGLIFVHYIFDYFDGDLIRRRAVRDSLVFTDDIEDDFEIIDVPVHAAPVVIDGMVLKRVIK